MNTNMTGVRKFSNIVASLCFGSLTIGRVNDVEHFHPKMCSGKTECIARLSV